MRSTLSAHPAPRQERGLELSQLERAHIWDQFRSFAASEGAGPPSAMLLSADRVDFVFQAPADPPSPPLPPACYLSGPILNGRRT